MPKRKLADVAPRSRNPQTTALTTTFTNGVQTLSRALRTARGFERQKLGRREQKAKSEKNDNALTKVREEIEALKGIEYTSTAEKYIFKQMIKTKRIAESDAFNEFKQNRNISTAGPGNVAEANVTARLFKTKPVQGATTGIMGGVRRVLGLEESEGKKNQSAAPRDGGGAKKSSTGLGQEDRVSKQEDTEEEWEGIVTSDDNDDDDDSLDYSQFDSRLAPGSDSESDPNEPDPERPSSVESSEDEVEVEEEEDDDNEEGGEEDAEEEDATSPQSQSLSPPPKKPKSNPPPAPTTKTTFLPSLSMGGYFSGSESEPSDTEEVAPQRKNRMGQQARRALWEKKYGARANHVQKEKRQEKSNRDSGWDLRRGATGPDGRGPGKRGRGQRMDGGGGHREKGREWKPAKKQEDNNKPIHPSWEAARKAKEQKETAAYQGKKVVFD